MVLGDILLLIRKARILHGKHWVRANILINANGKIVKIFRSDKTNRFLFSKINSVYNAKEKLVLPGIVDMHVHFREPGQEHKENFESGSKAAIAGGITTIADMPNNVPRINDIDLLNEKYKRVKNKSFADFLLYLEISDKLRYCTEYLNRLKIRPAGVKTYLFIPEEERIFLSGQYPKDLLQIIHAEDSRYISSEFDCDNYSSFEASRPRIAEKAGVLKAISVAEKGYRVHVTHISTLDGLMEIIKAKRRGINITVDVTVHHLLLTKKDGEKLKSLAKCHPPLRDELDRRFLLRALLAGYVDAIISDHAPHAPFEKKLDLCEAPPGIATIQYTLPLLFTLAKKIHLKDFRPLIKALSENPARILGLKSRGKIKPGYYADLIIFNHKKIWKISGEEGYSKAKLIPWEGMIVRGYVEATFLRGHLVYESGNFAEKIGDYAYFFQ